MATAGVIIFIFFKLPVQVINTFSLNEENDLNL